MFEKFTQTIVTAVASRNRVGNTGGTVQLGQMAVHQATVISAEN